MPHAQNDARQTRTIDREALFQVAPLKAFSEGVFEGDTPMSELMRHGDFGMDTLNRIDGEGILLDSEA